MPSRLLFLSFCALSSTGFAVTVLTPQVVTANRMPQAAEHVAATVRSLDGEVVRTAPALTLDGALRSVPAFSLFRRSDSLTANPTAQGVSLRGLGPSGASRSLVLLDGVPLNDPFGGWVAWTKVPRVALRDIEIVPGGGATAWGNAALGGVIQIRSLDPAMRANRAVVAAGDYGTRSFEFSQRLDAAGTTLFLQGKIFSTDGFRLVAPERRGPIDIPAWSRHRWLNARVQRPVTEHLRLGVMARTYAEKRGNGTPYQQNSSRENFVAVDAAADIGANFAWNAVAYGQDQVFASTFSGVNATRSAETPASDQHDVPATAVGGAWTGVWRHGSARTSFGADTRFARGETREYFTFAGGVFTRERIAGGRQLVSGVFALHEREFGPFRATLGGRLDGWRESDGHRREIDRASGGRLRDDRYADRDGDAFSPSAGLVWREGGWRVRANLQRAFRRPTLNELYRPFRVGPNITEANAALGTERVTSGELGVEWTWARYPATGPATSIGPAVPEQSATFRVTAFENDLRDAVGNVTLARGPGTFPLFGTIAAGGVGRQRLNLDRTRVQGIELSARWQPVQPITITADYLYNDATVRRASVAPALVGNRVAQVPRHSAAVGLSWLAPAQIVVLPRVRWIGRQFEDDENQLTLGEVVIGDLSISRALSRQLEVFATVENIGDARIETGRTSDGIVNIGTPRLFLAGIRGRW